MQLNADEFVPPSSLYDTSEKPRLDDAWVKYYGGETKGGIKRLSPLDDEHGAQEIGTAGPAAPPDTGPAEASHHRNEPALQSSNVSTQPNEERGPSRPPSDDQQGRFASTLRDFPREGPASVQINDPRDLARGKETDRAAMNVHTGVKEARRDRSSLLSATTPSFETWLKRWSPWLKRGGSVKVCHAFFQLTHGRGSEECFTSNSTIMEMTKLSRAQCIRNIHYLIELGFLEELGEINNKDAKGTYYRFHLVPLSLVSQ